MHPAREYEYAADHVQMAEQGKGEAGSKEYSASGRCRLVYTAQRVLMSDNCQTDTPSGVYDLDFTGDRTPAWSPGPPQRIPTPAGHHVSGAGG